MSQKPRKSYRWWHKLLGVALSLGLFCVVLEVSLRVVGVSVPTATVLGTFFQHDTQTGWSGRPNAKDRFQTSNFSVVVSHDEDGLRRCGLTTRIAADRDGAERMCWVLGDSTTWGWGIEDDAHFVALLNQDAPETVRFRNLGTPGFSTVQEYHRFVDLLSRGYKPDVVIVCFNNNDHRDSQMAIDPDPPRPYARVVDGELVFHDPPVGRSFEFEVGSFLRRNSQAVSFVSYHAQRLRMARRMRARKEKDELAVAAQSETKSLSEPERHSPVDPFQWDDSQRILTETLQRLKTRCDAEGIELAVATEFLVDPRVVSACETLGVRVLDTSKRYSRHLRSSDRDEILYFAQDPHINARGHRIFADAMLEELHDWHPEWRLIAPSGILATRPGEKVVR